MLEDACILSPFALTLPRSRRLSPTTRHNETPGWKRCIAKISTLPLHTLFLFRFEARPCGMLSFCAEAWYIVDEQKPLAGQNLLELQCYRSSVSRAYYAAYCAVTSELAGKYTFPFGGNNPSHPDLPILILHNLPALPEYKRRQLKQAVSRLWKSRVEADYGPLVTIGEGVTINALRDMNRVLQILEIEDE